MIKKILWLFIFIVLFISSMLNVFAFEASLTLDKEKVDINDYINMKVEINSLSWWQIWITSIEWIDNFNIISQSQSQNSSNSIIIVNGKTQSKVKTILNLNLVLKAKNKWEYNIWPAILKRDKEEVKTNIVKVTVSWDKLFINNNHLNINQVNPGVKKEKSPIVIPEDTTINTYNNIKQKKFNDNKTLYLFLLVIILIWLGGYFFRNYYKNNKKQKEFNSIVENHIDFEEKPSKIIYPELVDNDFIFKISNILKDKLWKKYKIQWVSNKTFSEILDYISERKDNKVELLINKINKAKYSNYIWDNNEILDGVRDI